MSTSGVSFVDQLSSHADQPALLSSSEVVTYRDLDSRVNETLARLGHQRRLVLLEGTNTVSAVTTYLAALRGNHPLLLVDGGRPDRLSEIVDTFDPDVIVGRGWSERRAGTKHELHPNLRLLLSTSGSTGSPKLVRLSADNLQSNAESIASYLRLTPDDRAISSLPLGYCYGLSVVHSHLAAGSSVVLTDRSVIDPQFWRLAQDLAITSFAGVPHTFALLDRTEEPWFTLPTLRYVTQAGGRLTPSEVQRISRLGRRHGWGLYVMYGQTEATARMSYLEPREAEQHPDSIGRPIPGGTLRIDTPSADGVGELVYSGPNVMMGYASKPADLAQPGTLAELRTGDLARRDGEDRFTIVGRASRFAKLLGHRIDLDQLQGKLRGYDPELVCVSDDSRLLVAVTRADPTLIRRAVSRLTGLPPLLVSVRQYAEIPRLPNGKPDLPALAASPNVDLKPVGDLVDTLRRAYEQALGYDHVAESATFVQLGGDSLSFVELSVRLEELLGRLPNGWPEMSIHELAGTAGSIPEPANEPKPAPSTETLKPRWAWLDASIVLRALAITMVVLVHLEIWGGVRGGAHLLLGIAGFTFARFPLSAIRQSDRIVGFARSITRLAVPSMLFIAIVVVATGGYSVANIFLVNHYFGPPRWTETWNFWFVEALVEILLAMLALLAISAVRRFERRHTLLLPALLLGAGLLFRYDVFGQGDVAMRYGRPHMIFWLFALGWLAQRAQTAWQRVAVSVVVAVTLTGYFLDEPVRGLVVQVGLLMLIWLPTLPVPPLTASLLRGLAAASLWIYLTHWVVWPLLLNRLELPRLLVVVGCLLAGMIMAAAVTIVQRNVTRAWRGTAITTTPTAIQGNADPPPAHSRGKPAADAGGADEVDGLADVALIDADPADEGAMRAAAVTVSSADR
ncbi:MAG TPA: AMP-binding protein [Propionibacteriaceae bacterium]|nr:AMP-binding protein [Propionibacteriaceae bacterium]